MLPRVQRLRPRYPGAIGYRYHRITGARLPDLPEDHPDFIAAWLAEEAKGAPKVGPRPPGTIGRAIEEFLDSRDLTLVSETFRVMVRRHLLAIDEGAGWAKLADLAPKHVRLDTAKLEGAVALHRHKAWRRFLAWCVTTGRLEADPSAGVQRPKMAATAGHVAWSAGEVAQFRARWPIGTAPRAAMELLHWTAARTGDAAGLTRGMVRDGLMTYRQSKTGGEAHVPWDGQLPPFARAMRPERDLMHAALAALPDQVLLILPKEGGLQRSAKGLQNTVNDAARDAKLVRRTAHGLRKTRLIALAEAGATAHQIAAWGGHESLKEVEHYTKAADRRRALSPNAGVNRIVKRAAKPTK